METVKEIEKIKQADKRQDRQQNREEQRNNREHPEVRPEDFHWVVFGLCVGALFMLMIGAFLIVRIADGKWLSWQLPAILAISYLVVVSVTAMMFVIKTVKQEIAKQNKK